MQTILLFVMLSSPVNVALASPQVEIAPGLHALLSEAVSLSFVDAPQIREVVCVREGADLVCDPGGVRPDAVGVALFATLVSDVFAVPFDRLLELRCAVVPNGVACRCAYSDSVSMPVLRAMASAGLLLGVM